MLFVVSKEKIMSYMIAFSTVAVLLGISALNLNGQNTVETAGNVMREANQNYINNVINQE